jgi:L-fuculose-phosphate aldolase
MDKSLTQSLQQISKSLFDKNFFGVFHGSISAKISETGFVINKRDTILDEVQDSCFIGLDSLKRDYRWNQASRDVEIHEHIYENISSAKYITFTMPPYTTALSLTHSKIIPQDYYGQKLLGNQLVYDPKNFEDWMNRAPFEIPRFFQNNKSHIMVIRGFGVIAYDRDLIEMAKTLSILESSCRLLAISYS